MNTEETKSALAGALGSANDPDIGPIGPGHICKHHIRWPHECVECRDQAYQLFVDECAKHCQCSDGPCDGVLAGGLCDSPNAPGERPADNPTT